MKSCSRVFLLALFVAAAPLLLAQNSGPSANGDFAFTAGDSAHALQFNARIQNNGQTHGEMTFTGPEELGDQDVDGGGDANPGGSQSGFFVKASFDCLKIIGNRAVMSGEITDSSVPAYIGLQTVLVVEDSGEGAKRSQLDKFTWGVYRGNAITWVPTDAELTFDSGAGLTWLATDAERNDDPGIPSHPGTFGVDCNSFPPSAYDLINVPEGAGNIQVKP